MTDITAVSANGEKYLIKSDGTWSKVLDIKSGDEGFRGFQWGDSLEKVKREEKTEIVEHSDDCLIYSVSVANLPAFAVYFFANGQLVTARYSFKEDHASKQSYLHDFWSVKELLTKKYGEPEDSHVVWHDDLYKDDVSEWGMAISIGHLFCFEQWNKGDTEITLSITGDNYEIQHGITYKSKLLSPLLEGKRQLEAMDGL